MLLVVNEIHQFTLWANVVMFGLGLLDNSTTTFISIVLGFEFESKIVPFGAKNFTQNLTVFIVVANLSIFDISGKDQFRMFFAGYFIIGIISTIMMMFFPY